MKRLLLTLIIGLWLAHSGNARATIVLEMNTKELTRSAGLIVHARVVAKRVQRAPQSRRIYTVYTLQPLTRIKRDPLRKRSGQIDVWVLGGVFGGYAMRTPGTTKMSVGEEVVVFLTRHTGRYLVVGLSQGKFQVFRHKTANALWVRSGMQGLTLARKSAKGYTMAHPKPLPERPLTTFIDEIKQHLKAK